MRREKTQSQFDERLERAWTGSAAWSCLIRRMTEISCPMSCGACMAKLSMVPWLCEDRVRAAGGWFALVSGRRRAW